MIVRVLGSGSKGNSVLLEASGTRVLIDAGFSPRGMQKRLEVMEIAPGSVEAVIITHEHIDHVRGAATCAKRWGWKIYASAGTRLGCPTLRRTPVETVSSSTTFTIGQLDLTTIRVPHDANEPMALVASSKETGARAGIVYDLGVCSESLARALQGVDILMIEANHDVTMLRNGPYPPALQRRIASRYGHLSNDAAAAFARRCAHSGLSHVVLAHLSEKNNRPDIATAAVRAALRGTAFSGEVTAAAQGRTTGPFLGNGVAYCGPEQLMLAI